MARRAGRDRVIEFPYLVMFRNENGHFVSVGGGSEFKTEKEATAKTKEKCDELKTTVYVQSSCTSRRRAINDLESAHSGRVGE
jgi:hypothetical protein